MRRPILVVAICLLIVCKSSAQSLHAFLFCNTSDPSIGFSVRVNFKNMKEELQTITNGLAYKYVEHSDTAGDFRVENVLNDLDTVKIHPNDIVFMYFSTHGAKSTHDSSIFPQIVIPHKLVAVYKLYQAMLAKNPRSVIAIVEACSGFQNITPQQAFIYQMALDTNTANIDTALRSQNTKNLFSTDCNIIMTAGQPGKDTWATMEGSMFTNCFLRALTESLDSRPAALVNWDNLLEQCKEYTLDMTITTPTQYYPVWEKTKCNSTDSLTAPHFLALMEEEPSKVSHISRRVKLSILVSKEEESDQRIDIKLKLSGPSTEIAAISKVEYFLDAKMFNPKVMCINKNERFAYEFSTMKGFPMKAKVFYNNGIVVDLYEI